ncbi:MULTISPECIES: Yip1 family protein [Bacillus cereus group]|uniref:YIP1 family protein n=2 Tax=Bacillus cereus group TaxID=86661 RepID=A0AAW5KYR2_BACCE|nr:MULTISPECIES: Yip1 family protein [Bacillus cereus group]MCQ6285660.1 YIP1 family protein [Bacillus cereus]MCQ6303374.1 YIP1 family protein [Bacillus cereus]MCQ6314519.1 YIP1 family protein [Bacillus cereus]MCQ6327645.1 YIP1 family protein [Bacillus cereus]MCQ6343965.1 YIP1 family protein [Bacillus cereus]
MEANINTQDVGAKKPSLLGMITSPGEQFERMKASEKVWGMFFLVTLLQGLVGGLTTYVVNTSPEMIKMQKELGELAGKGSITSEVIYGIGSGFVGAMIGALFVVAIYKVFMMFFGNDTSYKKLLTIVVYTNIILIIGGLINGIIALILDGGATQYTSLGPLFEQGSLAYGIGNTIELFYLWNLVLIWLGLQVIAGLSKVKAAMPIIVLFIIKAVFLAAILVLIAKFLPGMPI